jgi:hypothetical protein
MTSMCALNLADIVRNTVGLLSIARMAGVHALSTMQVGCIELCDTACTSI